MLELDTTIMTPATVFETSGHVARFADWMVKDVETGDVLRADHLVKGVLEARLGGDREARGVGVVGSGLGGGVGKDKDDKKNKKNKAKGPVPVKLEDGVVKEYETILAQVCARAHSSTDQNPKQPVQLDNYTGPELGELCRKYSIKNPDTDNAVGEPQQFNLMFASSIGPTGQHPG
jgi:glycyl-tRNA synthetase